MQKWVVFHLISKHSLNIYFLCIFFYCSEWVWEVWYNLSIPAGYEELAPALKPIRKREIFALKRAAS